MACRVEEKSGEARERGGGRFGCRATSEITCPVSPRPSTHCDTEPTPLTSPDGTRSQTIPARGWSLAAVAEPGSSAAGRLTRQRRRPDGGCAAQHRPGGRRSRPGGRPRRGGRLLSSLLLFPPCVQIAGFNKTPYSLRARTSRGVLLSGGGGLLRLTQRSMALPSASMII